MVFGSNPLCIGDCLLDGPDWLPESTVLFDHSSACCGFAGWKVLTAYFLSGVSVYTGEKFFCVGIPYFCIGNLIREKHCTEKWNKKVLQVLVVVFAITSLIERFVLVNIGLNATRDYYASTTFIAICFFVYALKSNWKNKGLAALGRKYSTWIYIVHLIFITIF